MALLEITAISTSSTGAAVAVRAELTDSRGVPITGFAPSGAVVLPTVARTDDSGFVSLDLVPNSSITEAGTFYTIVVGGWTVRILKTSDTQTLLEAASLVP